MTSQLQRALNKSDVIFALGYDPQGAGQMLDLAIAGTDSIASAWTAFASTVTATAGTLVSSNGTVRSKKVGRIVAIQAAIRVVGSGNGSGAIMFTLPYPAAVNGVLSGVDFTTGKAITARLIATSTAAQVGFYDGTFPGSTGAALYVSGVYESVA